MTLRDPEYAMTNQYHRQEQSSHARASEANSSPRTLDGKAERIERKETKKVGTELELAKRCRECHSGIDRLRGPEKWTNCKVLVISGIYSTNVRVLIEIPDSYAMSRVQNKKLWREILKRGQGILITEPNRKLTRYGELCREWYSVCS